MDRGQGLARLLAVAALLSCVAADRPQLPVREARWLKSPDLARGLTTLPPECLAWPKDEAQRRAVAAGRILFRSPLLLGGQAARAGLSCASCHRNGRGNPHFHFPGISGAPGTADVTASLMSAHRGDGIFNPKPIPDLAGSASTLKVKGTPHLRGFVQGLIVEEFDGPEPSPAALDAILAYVRALDPAACKGKTAAPVTLGTALADVDSAVALAEHAYAGGDPAIGRALLAAARATLGTIDERFQLPGLGAPREALRAADGTLFRLQQAGGAADWKPWKRDWRKRKHMLRSSERRSLFNPAVLRKSL